MRFADPLAFFGLLLVPLVLLAYLWHERLRVRRLERVGDVKQLLSLSLSGKNAGQRARLMQAILLAFAAGCTALALTRPQFGMRTEVRKGRGMDVVLAMDLSRSMFARDVVPSRLERAKIELQDLIGRLAGDRLGLVGFTSVALPLCPLTVDHSALKLQLQAAVPGDLPRGGTAIGDAIQAGQRMLEASGIEGSAKAIIIVTDGEEHEGKPMEAAQKAKEAGIEVHMIGVGSRTGEPIPIKEKGKLAGYLKDSRGQTVVSRLNENMLREIATAGGGLVALPGQGGGLNLSNVRDHLATQKKAELQDRMVRIYEERYQWALVPAFLALLLATLIRPTRRARFLVKGAALMALLSFATPVQAAPFEKEDPDVQAGNTALKAGRGEEAVKAYDQAKQRLGDDPRLLFNRALAESARGERDRAISDLQAALESSSDPQLRGRAAYALGNTYRQLKRYDEALKAYRRALLEDPKQTGARRNLEITRSLKRIQEAQPKKPNENSDDKDKNDKGDKNDKNKDQPDAGTGDSGPQDGSQDSGTGDGSADAGVGNDGSSDNQGDGGGGQDGSGAEDPQSGPDAGAQEAGAQPQQSEAEQAKEDPNKQDVKQLLDALQEQEKALKRKRLLRKYRGRKVKKDW